VKLKTDENELLQAFTRLIKLPLPDLRASLAHKAIELEHLFKDEIEEYREIESFVDRESKQEKPTEAVKESVKLLNFELEKIKDTWTVFPIVHPAVIDHILAHAQECEEGIIKMEKITIDGDTVDLGFVKKNENFFTCQIQKKYPGKSTKQAKQETTSKTPIINSKTADLMTFILYLKDNKTLFERMLNEFFEYWKPLIDDGLITDKLSER
jgi:hypothetical protein